MAVVMMHWIHVAVILSIIPFLIQGTLLTPGCVFSRACMHVHAYVRVHVFICYSTRAQIISSASVYKRGMTMITDFLVNFQDVVI
jgi:hypothetical protein